MAHGVVCHFDLPHMAQKVADWTRREGRPRADEMAHGAAENNRRVTRVNSSLWPHCTVPKLPSGTNGCQTLKTATLNTSYFCQKRPLCQPPPSPTPPPNSHFVRKVKLRLALPAGFRNSLDRWQSFYTQLLLQLFYNVVRFCSFVAHKSRMTALCSQNSQNQIVELPIHSISYYCCWILLGTGTQSQNRHFDPKAI